MNAAQDAAHRDFDPGNAPTLDDIVEQGRSAVSRTIRDYVEGGTETERTKRRNAYALEQVLLQPRILRDVERRDISTSFVGVRLETPVVLAPVGSLSLLHPDGSLAFARGAHGAGTTAMVPLAGSPPLEDVAGQTQGPLILQLYVWGDRAWMADAVSRAESAGCAAVCITVDRAVDASMRRNLRNGFAPMQGHQPPRGVTLSTDARLYAQRWDWRELEWLRTITDLRLILKGVSSPADAEQAVRAGVDVVYVSNHGGRALDGMPATIEVLPEIARAVAGQAQIAVDGGFQSGTDVVKALALGADVVAVGRLHCWALAAGGQAAVTHMLRLLGTEITEALALLGVRSIAELDATFVRPLSGNAVGGLLAAEKLSSAPARDLELGG